MELYYKLENDHHKILHLILDLLIGIFLFLFTFSCLKVSALEVYTANMSGNQSNVFTVTNGTSLVDYNFNPIFHDTTALGSSGYLNFTIGVNKISGGATDTVVSIRGVAVTIGDVAYVCNIGTSSIHNSTFNEITYSLRCPVNMGGGLHRVYVALNDLASNNQSSYKIIIGSGVSYERIEDTSINVNVNTSGIIDNQTQNTQNIINNQNSNTQQQIESQKVCSNISISKDDINLSGKYLTSDGALSTWSRMGVTDYFEIFDNTINVILPQNTSSGIYQCFYNSNKVLISCLSSVNLSDSFQVPLGTKYARFTIDSNLNRPQFSIKTCKNGNQAIADWQNQINNNLTNDDITDIHADNSFSDITQISDTPITDLLLMPLNLLNKFIDVLDGNSCSPYTIPFDFFGGSNTLIFPCFNGSTFFGSSLWSTIDLLFCGFMVYNIGLLIVHFYEEWSSLHDTFDGLYEPKHATYKPRHAAKE